MGSMKISLADAYLSWNCSWSRGTCCEYHAVVAELLSLSQELQSHSCRKIINSANELVQCPVCSVMLPKETDGSNGEEVLCHLCGFEGPGLQCRVPVMFS